MHAPAIINAQILPSEHLSEIETSLNESIGADLSVGIDPDKGAIRTRNGDGLEIDIDPSANPPQWAEFTWVGGSDLHARHSRFLLRVSASAQYDTTFNAALRINAQDGFEDVFSGGERALGLEPAISTFEFTPSRRQLDGCVSVHLQLFLPTSKNCIFLHKMDVTALD